MGTPFTMSFDAGFFTPLGTRAGTIEEMTLTLDVLEPDVRFAGSFSARWADAGDGRYGDIAGTFDIDCATWE